MDVKELRVLAKRTSAQPAVSSSCSHENDLISRQAAIDASCKDWCGCKYDDCPHNVKEYKYCDGCDTVVILENLPSVQPEKALKDCRNCKFSKYNDHYGIRFCYESDDCIDWNLWEPKKEPEIIRCKDCKYWDGEKPIADGRYWCIIHGSFMYYCSDAERRTDEPD